MSFFRLSSWTLLNSICRPLRGGVQRPQIKNTPLCVSELIAEPSCAASSWTSQPSCSPFLLSAAAGLAIDQGSRLACLSVQPGADHHVFTLRSIGPSTHASIRAVTPPMFMKLGSGLISQRASRLMQGCRGSSSGYRWHQPRRLPSKAMTWSGLQRQDRGPDEGGTGGAGKEGR